MRGKITGFSVSVYTLFQGTMRMIHKYVVYLQSKVPCLPNGLNDGFNFSKTFCNPFSCIISFRIFAPEIASFIKGKAIMKHVEYDVFISCKSEDYSKVEPIYHWLMEKGYRTFFSPISLRIPTIQGDLGVFGDEIDDALDSADNMIVFTSNAEYVKTGYVKDEWRTFVEEQRAGRKSGSLVTILDGIKVANLPIRLRQVQSFTLSNYKQGILRFLSKTIEIDDKKESDELFPRKDYELIFTVGNVSFKMVRVEGGVFQMGSPNDDMTALDDEKPQHVVTLNEYYIGETVVTQALWKVVMGNNPSQYKGDDLPAEMVSWNDCQRFIDKLNGMTRRTFRLPTEAEWEYAARGGNKSKGYTYSGGNDINEVAWYWQNSGDKFLKGEDKDWARDKINDNNSRTHHVKEKKANELGLYDMSGNVWEWCQDWYGKYSCDPQINPIEDNGDLIRVIRGGGYVNSAKYCRVSSRYYDGPGNGDTDLGFRLVLEPEFITKL